MINKIIDTSIQNRVLVFLLSVAMAIWGWQSFQKTPLDAIPDLSDVQVIIKTSFEGQTPQVIEDHMPISMAHPN